MFLRYLCAKSSKIAMSYRKKLLQKFTIAGWCILLVAIAIYFFVLVPCEFSGWKDYLTYHAFFFLLFITTERLLLPWITVRLYKGFWVCIYPFLLQFIIIFSIVLLISIVVGGLVIEEGWDILNLWHAIFPLLLPNVLAIVLFVGRQGLQHWENSQRYQLQLLTQELNPHMLNTNMAKLRPLILWNVDIAVRFVKQNNVLLHCYLKNRRSLTIPLADELKQVNNLLKMEEINKQKPVFLHLEVDPMLLHRSVPMMMLVNLLSNCFSYGISLDSDRPIQLRIWSNTDGKIHVRMSNYKKASAAKDYMGTGTSLSRTADILRLLDPHSKMDITQDDHLFVVFIIYRISI